MFKNQLQELCQKRQWPLPVYTSTRDGPDHNPRFGASVTVNGLTFNSTELSRSYKEAHNKAAQIAIDALIPAPPPPQPPSDTQISKKSQLQNLLTRKNLVPVYSCVRAGPPHALRFKATVEFDGQIFESQQFCNTLKEAEQDAAKVALLALPPEESLQPKDESRFYKNLLQELAQKEGLSLPVYKTVRNGESHIPTFSSTVEIEGESFDGDTAKTKKQAEISAAKVAYCQLKERRAMLAAAEPSLSDPMIHSQPLSARPCSTVNVMGLKQKSSPVRMAWVKKNAENEESPLVDGDTAGRDASISLALAEMAGFKIVASEALFSDQEADSSGKTVDHGSSHTVQPTPLPKMVSKVLADVEDSVDGTSSEDRWSSAEYSSGSSHLHTVRVYPRKLDMVLPKGAVLLSFSDDKWAAVNMDFSNSGAEMAGFKIVASETLFDDQEADSTGETVDHGSSHSVQPPKMVSSVLADVEDSVDGSSSEDGMSSAESSSGSSRLHTVKVYPRKPDMVLPKGAVLLPFSDDKWAAVDLDFSNDGGDLYI